ncbi:MAG: SusC/RagA family TonB-linked outer membrane protein [Segetibacter sp.]|nr:SusC/RagA family TonB-linked outer membrane protein [Segetibacter sp.]
MRLTCHWLLKRSLLIPFFSLLLFQAIPGYSQTKKVFQGKVTDEKGVPLEGASVTVKGNKQGVSTNNDGSFSITAADGSAITISSIGHATKEVVLRGTSLIRVQLDPSASTLNDVVVVAYGTVRKKDLTGSVSVVNVSDAKKTVSYDVAKMLQGQAAGVSVQGSGEPGGFVQIKIRGISTFGNNGPLFVIDGVPVSAPFDFNPDDIESMQVLKDASSAALYGSRAATGVIIITTKKGKAGPLQVNYSGYVGAQRVPKRIPVNDRLGYQKITSQAELNAGLTIAPGNDPASPLYINNVNTDWQKEAFKTGIIQDHNISFSGGSEFATYNASLGYFDQSSEYRGPQNYTRYTLNTNLGGKKGIFSYGIKVSYTQSHKVNPFDAQQYHAVFGGSVTNVVTAIPTMPVYDPKRLRGFGGSDNATQRAISLNVIGMNNLLQDYSDRNRVFGNFWGQLELVKNLKYRLNVSYDRSDFKDFHFEPTFDLGWYYINNQSYMRQNFGNGYVGLMENTLTYLVEAGKHKIDFLAGTTYQQGFGENFSASAVGLPEPYFYSFNSVSDPAAKGIGSGSGKSTLVSYLGRINYNYNDRYLLTGNVRRDGSSRFSPANRYGDFASVAAAWNINNEKFLNLPAVISTLKLRGGYGVLGNQEIGDYLYQSYVNTNASYVFGNTLAPGTTTIAVVDPAIKWESKITSNVALDLGLLHDKFTLTAEYFSNTSKDILANIPLPLSVGSVPSSILTNAASLKNTGVEFTAAYHNGGRKFKYDINANFHTLTNKVLALGGINNPIYGAVSKTEIGRSVGEIYGFVTEGIFQTTQDVTKHAYQPNAAPGDVIFKDVTGDNKITDDDRVYLGSAIPKFFYGLNLSASYSDFDFSVFLQGSGGNKVYNGVYHDLMVEQYGNSHVDALNFWTPTNTKTNVPRPIIGDPNGNARGSDRFIESGTYVKLQNFQLGYTLPVRLLGSQKVIKSFRAYVSGQNVITFSKYRGYDPDFISDGLFSRGFDIGSFPNPRTLLVGVQVKF